MFTKVNKPLYGWVARGEAYRGRDCSVQVYVTEVGRDKTVARMRELGLEVRTFEVKLPSFSENEEG